MTVKSFCPVSAMNTISPNNDGSEKRPTSRLRQEDFGAASCVVLHYAIIQRTSKTFQIIFMGGTYV